MALLMVACTTPVSHGHIHEEEAIQSIKPGATRDQVLQALGSPSSESSFGLVTWYYVSTTKNVHSLLEAEVVQQDVTEVAFDGTGTVTKVNRYTLADGKKIALVKRITPTEGQQLGFFEQILSNLGRFNKDSSSGAVSRRPSVPPVR